VDDNPEIAEKYNVLSIPTIIIFKNGEIADTSIGLSTKAVLQKKIDTIKQ
jgi:thioredoxin 1